MNQELLTQPDQEIEKTGPLARVIIGYFEQKVGSTQFDQDRLIEDVSLAIEVPYSRAELIAMHGLSEVLSMTRKGQLERATFELVRLGGDHPVLSDMALNVAEKEAKGQLEETITDLAFLACYATQESRRPPSISRVKLIGA
mgnify:CR=1 FL=1